MGSQDAPLPSSCSSSSHRLPTVSASQALHNLHGRGARTVSTGISQLNKLLSPPSLPGHHHVSGGYMRGKVTEVFGPPGAGKTAFGIQAAVNALHEGQHVIWVDAGCAPLVPQRLLHVLSAPQHPQHSPQRGDGTHAPSPPQPSRAQVSSRFHHFVAPTLAHLLALFMHSPAAFPPQNTGLVVIDSLATLIDNAYPRNAAANNKNKTDQSRWAAGRRFAVTNELISTFARFAALHDIALLVTCPAITRIRGASRALLVPAVSGAEWENGVSTRLVLFRDWVRTGDVSDTADADILRRARFAGLVKANGVALTDEGGVGNVVPFAIESSGLCDISIAANHIAAPIVLPTQPRPPKRPFADVDEDTGEEPNSDELYGWIEDDEVAAEGLLIDETPVADTAGSRLEVVTEGHSNKKTRPSTL